MTAFLACDWGTSNLRAWVVDAKGRAGSGHAFNDGDPAAPAGTRAI